MHIYGWDKALFPSVKKPLKIVREPFTSWFSFSSILFFLSLIFFSWSHLQVVLWPSRLTAIFATYFNFTTSENLHKAQSKKNPEPLAHIHPRHIDSTRRIERRDILHRSWQAFLRPLPTLVLSGAQNSLKSRWSTWMPEVRKIRHGPFHILHFVINTLCPFAFVIFNDWAGKKGH